MTRAHCQMMRHGAHGKLARKIDHTDSVIFVMITHLTTTLARFLALTHAWKSAPYCWLRA
jgi:hypothetical protein